MSMMMEDDMFDDETRSEDRLRGLDLALAMAAAALGVVLVAVIVAAALD